MDKPVVMTVDEVIEGLGKTIYPYVNETEVPVGTCAKILIEERAEIERLQKECIDKEYEWIPMGDGDDVPFLCSKCCKTWKFYRQRTSRHCPNCGAPMKARCAE